tara:strand:- start:1926 stop:2459 length:534 start_codon:yes stop_codon:yes gene_type:complete
MKLTKEQKERLCDSKKKTSFSQRGSVELKSANTDKVFDSLGISFSVAQNEIIESAIFERTTRDCGGELLRKEPVRRFRKVGLDEWFSLDASMGNDFWKEIFSDATTDDSIEQYLINTKQKEKYTKESNTLPPINDIKNILPKEKKVTEIKEKTRSNVGIKILAVAVAAIAVYKIGIN